MTHDPKPIVRLLDRALEAVLTARLKLEPLPPALAVDAVDEALGTVPEYREARKALQEAFDNVALEDRGDLHKLEETLNVTAARCAEAGWRVAMTLALAGHGDEEESP